MSTIGLHSKLNISEAVREIEAWVHQRQQEMAYGLSNGHVTDNVM